MKQQFQALIAGRGPKAAWTQVDIPFDVAKVFGSKAQVPVAGTVNGFPFRNSLKPNGDGTHYLHINKTLLAGAKARLGDTVSIVMVQDPHPRKVAVPADLKAALKTVPASARIFSRFSYSHKKEMVDWICAAKKAETRARRVDKCLVMLAEKSTAKKGG